MNDVQNTINTAINRILEKEERGMPFDSETKLVDELGFTSMNIAQLIARLEIDLGIDPFADGGVAITDIGTVGGLYRAYTK